MKVIFQRKIGLNEIKTRLKAKTGTRKSVRAQAWERRHSSFHFKPWAQWSNLIFSVISTASNASWESCRHCSVLVSMPREINHRPVAAGVTHISLPLPLARHQAAGAPPQSREQWSSHALCKTLARTHLKRRTVIFYSVLCLFFFFFGGILWHIPPVLTVTCRCDRCSKHLLSAAVIHLPSHCWIMASLLMQTFIHGHILCGYHRDSNTDV